MSTKFEPLLPTAPATAYSGEAATRLAAGPGRALDSAAVSAAFVAMASAPAPPPAAACAHGTTQPSVKPTLTLQRDGDRVTHVRVECPCGQVIELECA